MKPQFHAPEHDHRYEAAAIKAERQDVADNPAPPQRDTRSLSDWEKAHILGQRAFYERSTQTIRACPENYCLAHRDPDSPSKQPAWQRYGDDNATRGWWEAIDKVLNTYGRWSTGDAIATAIGNAIKDQPRVSQSIEATTATQLNPNQLA